MAGLLDHQAHGGTSTASTPTHEASRISVFSIVLLAHQQELRSLREENCLLRCKIGAMESTHQEIKIASRERELERGEHELSPRFSYEEVRQLLDERDAERNSIEAGLLCAQQELCESRFQLDQADQQLARCREERHGLDSLRVAVERAQLELDLQYQGKMSFMAQSEVLVPLLTWMGWVSRRKQPIQICRAVHAWRRAMETDAWSQACSDVAGPCLRGLQAVQHIKLKHQVLVEITRSDTTSQVACFVVLCLTRIV
eukprot:TRINITY_DN314_c0_g2_i8.p1 TRINITY_DN314_c0_g2~~TRINITY_DN314_c0_g2_i8.p1  ORF type:complete len:257 (-),score=43.94 TRINITY_DN314_c0_g2_i8:565-1335(-)